MKLYVAMVNDRHTEPEAHVFSTAEAAVAFARQAAIDGALDRPDEIEEEQIEGWLYFARYSVEDDAVWVVEKTLDSYEED